MPRLEVPGTLISDYILKQPEGRPSELIILLHGYTLSGKMIFDWLSSVLPASAAVFAPNAPYPIPEPKEDGYRIGYSWYFYSAKTDEYLINEANAVSLITQGVEKLGLSGLPTRVIGYSQGGYLAPHVASALGNVKQIIGVACRFHEEDVAGVPSYRMDQVHGEQDDTVDFEPSRESHRALIARGARGEYFSDPESGHRMSKNMISLVGRALALP
jgi:predicted esterase